MKNQIRAFWHALGLVIAHINREFRGNRYCGDGLLKALTGSFGAINWFLPQYRWSLRRLRAGLSIEMRGFRL